MVALCMEGSARHGGNHCERWDKIGITRAFKSEF